MGLDRPADLSIRGPLSRGDLPDLYARVCRLLEAHAGGDLVIDVAGAACDAVSVEALARLALGARRHGCRARLRNASLELRRLIAFAGLAGVVVAR